MNTLSPEFSGLKSNLKQLLLEGVTSFEDGFEILDVDLEIDENITVDVLAKDGKGDLSVVLFADEGETDLVHRILELLCLLRKHRFLLQRLYKNHEFDFSVPPRILVIASRITEDFLEKLDFIMAGEIVPYEYLTLKIDGKDYLTFTRRDTEESSDIKAVPLGQAGRETTNPGNDEGNSDTSTVKPLPTKTEKTGTAESDDEKKKNKQKNKGDYQKYFHEAKKKILRISNDIVESVEGPLSRFKINDQILVTLSRENKELSVFLGDTDEERVKVHTEEKLNEVLNLIFKRYFTDFSSIAKS